MINSIFLTEVLSELSNERDSFFSEFDFQFSFAWKMKEKNNNLKIRLERPFKMDNKIFELDILAIDDTSQKIGIELKYLKDRFETTIDDEVCNLERSYTNGGSRYLFLSDINRLELLKKSVSIDLGFAIVLANVKNCFTEKTRSNRYNQILLNDGRQLKKGEEIKINDKNPVTQAKYPPFNLEASYDPFCWKPYSLNHGFKYLMITI